MIQLIYMVVQNATRSCSRETSTASTDVTSTTFYITGTTTSAISQLNSDVYIPSFGALTALARSDAMCYFFHFKPRKDYNFYVVCSEAMIKTAQLKPIFNKSVVKKPSTKLSSFD